MTGSTRTLVVWCADWPVVAAGVAADVPAVVLYANRVVACSAAARAEGIHRGLRKREAQARCPEVTVVPADPDRDGRAFEPVAAAVEALAPRLEVVRPGVLAVPSRGPSRYYGGDDAAGERCRSAAFAALDGRALVGAGIADGLVAAVLAARGAGTAVIEPGTSASYLAPHPVDALARVLPGAPVLDLVGLFKRLGLQTLGDVAALPPASLLGRFGPLGATASRLARGLDERPVRPRSAPPDLVVAAELDPPAEQVEIAAFLARTLATELGERLSARGMVATRVSIEVETEHGETMARLWRHEGGFGAAQLADRVRWQLDGWLHAPTWGDRPSAGITVLRLVPDQVVPDDGRQLGFWGGVRAADERAARGVARLQGLLGPDAVLVAERRGGRGPGEQLVLVPAHGVQLGTAAVGPGAGRPWPGALPAPSPAVVPPEPRPARVLDAEGQPVRVSGRGEASGPPVTVDGLLVTTWCGPWPTDERWWDARSHRRRARLQVVLADGSAHLLVLEHGVWAVEATYD
jgi:protein ImuB